MTSNILFMKSFPTCNNFHMLMSARFLLALRRSKYFPAVFVSMLSMLRVLIAKNIVDKEKNSWS